MAVAWPVCVSVGALEIAAGAGAGIAAIGIGPEIEDALETEVARLFGEGGDKGVGVRTEVRIGTEEEDQEGNRGVH